MIQRIQSIWLLLAALCGVSALFVPFAIQATSPKYTEVVDLTAVTPLQFIPALLTIGAFSILSLVAIFGYKNRKSQLRFCYIAALGALLTVVLEYFKIRSWLQEGIATQYAYGLVLAPAALLFILLAVQSIRKDEKLVRSLDRLR
jgi:hypothetical protein